MSILFENVKYLDEQFEIQDGFLAVNGDKIVYIGADAPAGDFDETINGKGRLLMPGMYNMHTHLAMTLLRGHGENLTLQDWLFTKIFPFEAKLTPEAIYWGAMLGMAECIRFGTISATDMYMDLDMVAKAAADSGFKINAALMEGVGVDEADFDFEGLISKYHNSENGRLKVDSYVNAEYTTGAPRIEKMRDLAKKYDLNMHIHISETEFEHLECKGRHDGLTPIEYFDTFDMFERPTTIAHGVWLEDSDMDICAAKGITVAHNPVSNLKLASGIAPVPTMVEKGVNVALGTDGVASNNNTNLWEELKLAAMVHKGAARNPLLISTTEALKMATVNGAASQGRENCGVLKVGYQADIIALDVSAPHFQPIANLANHIVFAAQGSDVVMTMIDGEILYEDGRFTKVDIEEIKAKVNEYTEGILAQL